MKRARRKPAGRSRAKAKAKAKTKPAPKKKKRRQAARRAAKPKPAIAGIRAPAAREVAGARVLPRSQIDDRLRDYFSEHYGQPRHVFVSTLNIPQAFNETTPAWATHADTISLLPWMQQMRARITQFQMSTRFTIAAITDQILESVRPRPN